jgi:hypothetical protein
MGLELQDAAKSKVNTVLQHYMLASHAQNPTKNWNNLKL